MQARFHALITRPEALAHCCVREPSAAAGFHCHPSPPLQSWVAAATEADARAALGVYANMYAARLVDCLEHDFPSLAAVMGSAAFERLVAAYLLVHPSRSPSLRQLGNQLPAFLGEHPSRGLRPDLSDLARLEWARVEAFDASEMPLHSSGSLAVELEQRGVATRLRAVSSLAIVETGFAVDEVWLAVDRGEPPPGPRAERRWVVVWRRDWVVRHRALSLLEARALAATVAGADISELCSLFAGSGEVPDAAQAAFTALQQWAADGLLQRQPEPNEEPAGANKNWVSRNLATQPA
jgi:hypothetical protein